jgi:hypothetical protein
MLHVACSSNNGADEHAVGDIARDHQMTGAVVFSYRIFDDGNVLVFCAERVLLPVLEMDG